MSDPIALDARLQLLRDAFDDSFAHAANDETVETLDMLDISVGRQRFLVPVSQLRSVHAARPITAVPMRAGSLLGLIGLRGAMFALHDLGTLLGVPTDKTAPWLLVARRAPVAFAFQAVERHLRLNADAMMAAVKPDQLLGAEAVLDQGTRRSVIQIDRVVEQLLTTSHEHTRGNPNGE